MQWPAVFIPALRKNRLPSRRQGVTNVFHVIPAAAVPDADRYRCTEADEIRLFYVALTRVQSTSLSLTRRRLADVRGRPSSTSLPRNPYVLTAEVPQRGSCSEPKARYEIPDVTLSFSDLKYFFECPYQFKLRFIYGFNPPIHEALGYSKSVHDMTAEIHMRAIDGDIVSDFASEELVDRHLNAPFAYPALREQLRQVAVKAVTRYLAENRALLPQTRYSEQQVQVDVAARHHGGRPDRPQPAARHQRDVDRRLQIVCAKRNPRKSLATSCT